MTIPCFLSRGLGRRTVLLGMAAPVPALAAAVSAASASAVVSDSPGMADVVEADAVPQRVYGAGLWCEGPVWAPGLGGLVFSDVRLNRIQVLEDAGRAGVLRNPSGHANGNALDAQGRLISCEGGGRRVVRREGDGALTVLAAAYAGKPLNSPNDLAVAPDGAIWFTDPTFGLTEPQEGRMAPSEQAGRFVFRLDPGGKLDVAEDSFEQPNGIVFSPDFRRLYVSDTSAATNPEGTREIRVFDLGDGVRLTNGRLFARVQDGIPDGLDVDAAGRVYAATDRGVQVWRPDGTPLGRIAVPGTAGNLAFGGASGRTLFICNGTSVHAVDLKVSGAHRG